jgi:tripartite ATP-independent transporter DctM subunit
MSPEIVAILMFVGVVVGVLLGYPLGFVLAGLGMIFGLSQVGIGVVPMFISRTMTLARSYVLIAAPLFIFMGVMLERSGASEKMYHAMHLWMGGLRGGLAIGTILVCTLFAACTGIIGASVVTMGLIALPAMLSRGYDKRLTAGTICAGGTLGILIPPSIMLVVYGPQAGISVGKLFIGAIVPGLVLSALFILYIGLRCLINPRLGPPMPVEERRVSLGTKTLLLGTSLLPPLFLILAVLGTIFFGVASPTEAAGMGAFASIILAAIYGKLNLDTLKETGKRTIRASAMVFMVALGASMFVGVFMKLGGSKVIGESLLGLPWGRWGILGAIMFIVFILGMFIDWLGIVFIMVPLFTPIAEALGFDALWFAMLICINLQMSFLTPPFAYAAFYLRGVAPPDLTIGHIYRSIVPFLALQATGLVLCIVFPSLITWLPSLMITAH